MLVSLLYGCVVIFVLFCYFVPENSIGFPLGINTHCTRTVGVSFLTSSSRVQILYSTDLSLFIFTDVVEIVVYKGNTLPNSQIPRAQTKHSSAKNNENANIFYNNLLTLINNL